MTLVRSDNIEWIWAKPSIHAILTRGMIIALIYIRDRYFYLARFLTNKISNIYVSLILHQIYFWFNMECVSLLTHAVASHSNPQ